MSKVELRSSQLITTFGPGAVVELPEMSAIVGGLNLWKFPPGGPKIIEEPRLFNKITARLGKTTIEFRAPPAISDDPAQAATYINVLRFPNWFLSQKKEYPSKGVIRRRLVHKNSLDNLKYIEAGKKYEVTPVRFVAACENGHIDEIDWPSFVHNNQACGQSELFFEERGTSGALINIFVGCLCGISPRSLMIAAGQKSRALGHCNGKRPWLEDKEPGCDRWNRLLIRTASNAYFPHLISAISIPENQDTIYHLLKRLQLDRIKDKSQIQIFRDLDAYKSKLEPFSDTEIWEALERLRNGYQPSEIPVKVAEMEVFSSAKDELGSDKPDNADFYARALPEKEWKTGAPWMSCFDKVILVHRLREVVVQLGFTRFEPISTDFIGELPPELALNVKIAALGDENSSDWLPAIENRGEGIFLKISSEKIKEWLERKPVTDRAPHLGSGFARWKSETDSHLEFPRIPYYMLHTLSHALMTSISLNCGYPSSSLRERVYFYTDDKDQVQAGILIFTSSPDAEGTLGGLIEAGRKIKIHVLQALENLRICANDPICANHGPTPHDHSPLHGAACHGCVLVPETSCEQQNHFLDRSLVVKTVTETGTEFFVGY